MGKGVKAKGGVLPLVIQAKQWSFHGAEREFKKAFENDSSWLVLSFTTLNMLQYAMRAQPCEAEKKKTGAALHCEQRRLKRNYFSR